MRDGRFDREWRRRLAVRVVRLLAGIAALVYVLLDVVMLVAVRPLAHRLAALPWFQRLGTLVDRLGPRATLALLLVPLVVLEPAKPVGAYLVAQGHAASGLALIVVAEVIKLTTVERLYARSRDKLLTIAWFARLHGWAKAKLDWVRATPIGRVVVAVSGGVSRLMARLRRRPGARPVL